MSAASERRRWARRSKEELAPVTARAVSPDNLPPFVVVQRQGHGEALCIFSIEDVARLAIAFAAVPAVLERLPSDDGYGHSIVTIELPTTETDLPFDPNHPVATARMGE